MQESGFNGRRLMNFNEGGMQLPETIMTASAGYFMALILLSQPVIPFLTTAASKCYP